MFESDPSAGSVFKGVALSILDRWLTRLQAVEVVAEVSLIVEVISVGNVIYGHHQIDVEHHRHLHLQLPVSPLLCLPLLRLMMLQGDELQLEVTMSRQGHVHPLVFELRSKRLPVAQQLLMLHGAEVQPRRLREHDRWS
jgi:hypothetical protein